MTRPRVSSAPVTALPASARLAWWGTSWLQGHTSPDDLVDAVLDGDVTHVVAGLPDIDGRSLLAGLTALRRLGATAFGAAFPASGDPAGLGGPPAFNGAALEAGEAVVALGAGWGLVPREVGPTVEWTAYPAQRRPLPDVGEADRNLRATLIETADELAGLDVAHWRPEVADQLIDLRHRAALVAPPGVPPRCTDLAARGLQALEITALARVDDGGALSATQAAQRRDALAPLERAGRRALVAACSPEVWPEDPRPEP